MNQVILSSKILQALSSAKSQERREVLTSMSMTKSSWALWGIVFTEMMYNGWHSWYFFVIVDYFADLNDAIQGVKKDKDKTRGISEVS